MHKEISIRTSKNNEMIDITGHLRAFVREAGLDDGIVVAYVPHTTAGVTINENADPAVQADIIMELKKAIPQNDNYSHLEGNSAAHIKSSLVGASEMVIVEGGELVLGTWQSVFFCEYDGPRIRKLHLKAIKTWGI